MKLLYITNGIKGGGGLERVLSIKASYFAEEWGYDVSIVTLNESKGDSFYHFSPRIHTYNIITPNNKLKYLISYCQGIQHIVNKVNPDIISVCDDGLKGLFIPLWLKYKKTSIIYERHASIKLNNSVWQEKLMNIGGNLYKKLIVLTHYNLTEWKCKNLQVIPNPLSFIPEESSTLNKKQIICVGALSYNKGYDLLIKAWHKIASDYPDWHISIFGRGDSKEYMKIIRELHLEKQIHFRGAQKNILPHYLDSSILVLPSRSEGFGMVLIEAMSCGLPCIAFDCPCGPRDIIENGVDGFLVPPLDIGKLAYCIKALIDNPTLRKEMGEKAKRNVMRYNISNVALQWKKLFQDITIKN